MTVSERKLGSPRRTRNGKPLVNRRSSSNRDGMRTARDTDAHTMCVMLGRQRRRAVGWNSKPV